MNYTCLVVENLKHGLVNRCLGEENAHRAWVGAESRGQDTFFSIYLEEQLFVSPYGTTGCDPTTPDEQLVVCPKQDLPKIYYLLYEGKKDRNTGLYLSFRPKKYRS